MSRADIEPALVRSGERYVAYYRVSTKRQGRSGLGLAAQKKLVASFMNGGDVELLDEFVEHESGRKDDRPQLQKALRMCRLQNATLIVAKLDRLSRSAAFLFALKDANVKFVCADFPEANDMVIGFMALLAQWEAEKIAERARETHAERRRRGLKVGHPEALRPSPDGGAAARRAAAAKVAARDADLSPIIDDIRASGINSYRTIARELNRRRIPTARGKEWTHQGVMRLLKRIS